MMVLLWLLLLSPVQAQQALERYCFASDAEALRARPLVEVVLVKGQDRVDVDGRCLNVSCDVKRSEILRRWVKTRLPTAEANFSSLDVPELECDMLATKRTRKNKELTDVQVNGRSFQVNAGQEGAEQTEEHILKVTSGGTATLRMTTSELKITCTNSGSGIYRLKFEQSPIAVPPVIVNGVVVPSAPPEQVTTLSTELEARKGTPVNIGQISKDLSNKDKNIGIPSGLDYETTTGSETVSWDLLLR